MKELEVQLDVPECRVSVRPAPPGLCHVQSELLQPSYDQTRHCAKHHSRACPAAIEPPATRVTMKKLCGPAMPCPYMEVPRMRCAGVLRALQARGHHSRLPQGHVQQRPHQGVALGRAQPARGLPGPLLGADMGQAHHRCDLKHNESCAILRLQLMKQGM